MQGNRCNSRPPKQPYVNTSRTKNLPWNIDTERDESVEKGLAGHLCAATGDERSCSTRSIIYCQTVKQYAHLFHMFELKLGLSTCMYDREVDPQNRLIQMLHSGSPEKCEKLCTWPVCRQQQMSSHPYCSNSLWHGGVNCKGVWQVIHFSPSKSIDAYLQESGWCGWESEQSDAQGSTLTVVNWTWASKNHVLACKNLETQTILAWRNSWLQISD